MYCTDTVGRCHGMRKTIGEITAGAVDGPAAIASSRLMTRVRFLTPSTLRARSMLKRHTNILSLVPRIMKQCKMSLRYTDAVNNIEVRGQRPQFSLSPVKAKRRMHVAFNYILSIKRNSFIYKMEGSYGWTKYVL